MSYVNLPFILGVILGVQWVKNKTGGRKSILTPPFYLKLLVLVLIISGTVVGSASPVKIGLYPEHQSIRKGQEFTVNISVDPAGNPITAAQFNLRFDSSFIEVKNVTEGSLFKQKGASTAFNPGIINNSRGTLINVWGLIITPGANITTNGTFAAVTMYAKSAGISRLNLTNVIVSSPKGSSVQINITNTSVNITLDDTKPPASVKKLKNASYAQYYINWTWTDPIDTDLSKVMIYLDGKFRTNVSRGKQYYNATGLIPGTTYTVSTKTVDIAGNVNKMWVNHSAKPMPDTEPPASIKNLKNASYAQYYINWTWTGPIDTDFSKVMIYLDGRFRTNVSKNTQYYNATGLIPGTLYTISTKTVDIAGNTNKTWVNHSTRTIPDKKPPASIKNLRNASYARNYIKWTWNDPVDADFSKVMVYFNGVFKANISKNTQYHNATGLTSGKLYTISTKTVDIAGNTNKTWVNHSARTMP